MLSAETLDDNLNGQIDVYHLTFSEAVNDTAWNKTGFSVDGYSLKTFSSTGTANYPDTANDNDIYLPFSESGSPDSASKPEITYSSTTGNFTDVNNSLTLAAIQTSGIPESDGAAPILYSVSASDNQGEALPGVQAGDKVTLNFSESISDPPAITANNIDTIFKGTFSWTWKDGNGFIGSTAWSGVNSILTITLSDGGGVPGIASGYTIILDSFTFSDSSSNISSHTAVISGDFGLDVSSPAVSSCTTADLDSDGYIDAVHITFNENIDDATVIAGNFDVAGVSGESFSGITGGDTASDNDIYITFQEDIILKTNATPNMTITQGAVKDAAGNSIKTSIETCTDTSPPAILSAIASEENILIEGPDSDDIVTLTFSEKTKSPTVRSSDIDFFLVLSGGHTWSDATGSWNTNGDVLTIKFGNSAFSATISTGDSITIATTTVQLWDNTDLNNISSDSATITGVFSGNDITTPNLVSISPANNVKGVAITTPLAIIFDERMDVEKTTGATKLFPVKDSAANTLSAGSIAGSFSESYSTSTLKHTITFTPTASLKNNYVYEIRLSTTASDTMGNALGSSVTYSFTTIINHSETNTVKSQDGSVSVTVSPGSMTDNFYIEISTDTANDPTGAPKITSANSKLLLDNDPFTFPISNVTVSIKAYNSQGKKITTDFAKPIEISISYPDSDNNGIVDGTSRELQESSLSMFWLDETNDLWVKLPDSLYDKSLNKITASVAHFTIFTLMGAGTTELNDAYAFPVPYMPSQHNNITFTNLSSECTIYIYTLNGELVKEIAHSGGQQETWNNIDAGSGIYLYLIKNDNYTKKGKLMIIR
ncbi:Ig-like domain-containing protein [Elusimicrobiota bacterium]